MTRLFMRDDQEVLDDKTRLLTSKTRTLALVTDGISVTADGILDYELAKGVFAIQLDHSRVTYSGDSCPGPATFDFSNSGAGILLLWPFVHYLHVPWRKRAISHYPQV